MQGGGFELRERPGMGEPGRVRQERGRESGLGVLTACSLGIGSSGELGLPESPVRGRQGSKSRRTGRVLWMGGAEGN